MPRYYRAYGLTIASDFPLPECRAVEESLAYAPDVVVAACAVDGPMPISPDDRLVRPASDKAYLAWSHLGRVSVDHGRSVTVDLLPDFDVDALSFVLLGPVMALLLHQRRYALLHGSAVAAPDGSAIIFLGDNGAGKSTLAAACVRSGLEFLSDDVVAVTGTDGETVRLQPGFGSTKLSRVAIAGLDPLPGTLLPAIPPTAAKLRLRMADPDERPRPIAHICIVWRESLVAPVALGPADRLAALMRYSFLPKLGAGCLTGDRAAGHFRACAALAQQVPVSVVAVPDSLAALPDFARELPARLALA